MAYKYCRCPHEVATPVEDSLPGHELGLCPEHVTQAREMFAPVSEGGVTYVEEVDPRMMGADPDEVHEFVPKPDEDKVCLYCTSGEDDSIHEAWVSYEPAEDDAVIVSQASGPYIVNFNARFIGEYNDRDDAEAAIREAGNRENWFPDVWVISDHGNAHLVTDWEWRPEEKV